MRILGIDVGQRRIGLAISDPSRTLARPLATLTVGAHDAVDRVAGEIARLADEEDGLAAIVVGMPLRLDGSPNEHTPRVSSREAESHLAFREPDWRKRKARLDAAAAAIILQDYLDRHA
jgi:putative Holliday junction resolvase